MTLVSFIFDVIETRSFNNVWYWISLAVFWSAATHWVIGVPFSMVQNARKHGGDAATDLHERVRINVNRLFSLSETSVLILLGVACFVVTSLAVLGFGYGVEFAQALVFIVLPAVIVAGLTVWTSHIIVRDGLAEDALYVRLTRHRFYVQLLSILSIFVTAMFGMYQTLVVGIGF